jgi:hypothetical protein
VAFVLAAFFSNVWHEHSGINFSGVHLSEWFRRMAGFELLEIAAITTRSFSLM